MRFALVSRLTGRMPPAMGLRGSRPQRRLTGLTSLITLSALLGLTLLIAAGDGVTTASASAAAAPYTFNFTGDPAAPQPWNPSTWDVVVNSRDTPTFSQLEAMQAQHGADCAPYPATHLISSYEGSVFLCHNHVMTAINAHGYGEIVLTPDHMIDFSGGEATIRFDLSTLRTSYRDWVDVWITPFEDNLVLPLNALTVDLQGPPARGIHVKMDQFNGTVFRANLMDNFKSQALPSKDGRSLEKLVGSPSAVKRTTFELAISPTHLKFGAPNLGYNWVDTALTGMKWTRGVVQLAHHSYNPTKDCALQWLPTCLPNTWHWSNFSISNAVPFTLLRGNPQVVHAGTPATVTFPAPAPKSAFLRFAGIGSIDVSFDAGKTWQPAQKQAEKYHFAEHFSSYWMPVPAGTTNVTVRGKKWFAGPWWIRDVSIWSTSPPVAAQPIAAPPLPTSKAVGAPPPTTPAGGTLVAWHGSHNVVAASLAALGVGTLFGFGWMVLFTWRRARLRRK